MKEIKDHNELFQEQEYLEQFERKKGFENPAVSGKGKGRSPNGQRQRSTKNSTSKRQHIKINPAKACQPLGAIFCASGFEGTMPFVRGAQGCVAYFRAI